MAEKKKGKKRKEEFPGKNDDPVEKPAKEEYSVAKWLKKNVPHKKTKFMYHNVEYFTGAKAVDALLDSYWGTPKTENTEAFFKSREHVVEFLDTMLRHKFFHRARKVPVSEQELLARKKKKKDKDGDKEKEKEKGDKTEEAESSHAEGRQDDKDEKDDAKDGKEKDKKKRKIRLEMHLEQLFVDGLDAYVWIYDPIPFHYWLFGSFIVLACIGICLFPLWPPEVRKGVYYLSVAAAGFLCCIIALTVLRMLVFCLVWCASFGKHHLWLLPNLTEDVGFLASFWPLYKYEYKGDLGKAGKKKKKKEKDSDNEQEDDKRDEEDEEESDKGQDRVTSGEETAQKSDVEAKTSDGERNSGSETESESSSQKSQTGRDFEIVNREEVESAAPSSS